MQTINPLVVSVGPTADSTPISPVRATEHGGGVKKVIAVAAAVIIPVAAPAIASSIAASGVLGATVSAAMTTATGAVVSSAITGAALGAVTAKVTGQSVKAGAIMGAIGGGFGGYRAASAGTFGTPQGGISATTDRYLGTNLSGQNAGTVTQSTSGMTPDQIQSGTGVSPDAAGETLVGAGQTGAGTAEGMTFLEKMQSVPSAVVSKVTDPDTLANLTIQAGAQLIAGAVVPDGLPELSTEEASTLEAYKQELAELKQRDEAAFNQKMDAAKQYLTQAGYFDPTAMGYQAAKNQQLSDARKLLEFQRKSSLTNRAGLSRAEARRQMLGSSRNVQSAFQQGFDSGVKNQTEMVRAGYNMTPNAPTGSLNALANMNNYYAGLRKQADEERSNVAEFLGGFATGGSKDKKIEDRLAALESSSNIGTTT
jgi:hypothetical protein